MPRGLLNLRQLCEARDQECDKAAPFCLSLGGQRGKGWCPGSLACACEATVLACWWPSGNPLLSALHHHNRPWALGEGRMAVPSVTQLYDESRKRSE